MTETPADTIRRDANSPADHSEIAVVRTAHYVNPDGTWAGSASCRAGHHVPLPEPTIGDWMRQHAACEPPSGWEPSAEWLAINEPMRRRAEVTTAWIRERLAESPEHSMFADMAPADARDLCAALGDVLTELERISERAPHPDPQLWARGAIASLAGVWGYSEDTDE